MPKDHRNHDLNPIFRWAGSKRQSVNEMQALAEKCEFSNYIEPFFGSGVLFFRLQPKRAIVSDNNPDLINAYRVLKGCCHKLHSAVDALAKTPETYYKLRSQNPNMLDAFSRAVRFVFLNRHAFNAIYRTNKKGEFNVPMGKDAGALPSARDFSLARKALFNAKVQCSDFRVSCTDIAPNTLVYLDPPYDYTGRRDRGEYGPDTFTKKDLPDLFSLLNSIDASNSKFLFSFIDCRETEPLKKRWREFKVPVRRQIAAAANARSIINEVIFTNF